MDTFGTRHNTALGETIKKMIEERLAYIIDKRCISYEDYLGQCLAVQALREVLIANEAIHKNLLKEATGQMDVDNPAVQRGHLKTTKENNLYRS
jgi:hypothetical protein